MNKAMECIKASNRWKHLVGGLAIGVGAGEWFCALYSGVGVAAALELKDKQHGGAWDWVDFCVTMAGVIVGRLIGAIVWSR